VLFCFAVLKHQSVHIAAKAQLGTSHTIFSSIFSFLHRHYELLGLAVGYLNSTEAGVFNITISEPVLVCGAERCLCQQVKESLRQMSSREISEWEMDKNSLPPSLPPSPSLISNCSSPLLNLAAHC
jgi:hypothetical protein